MTEYQDQAFVEFLVKSIVDNPDAVSTTRIVDEMGVLITLTVDPNDLGQVIGRQGQTAKAIRTLLRVVGAKNQARVNLKIYEPEGSRPPRMQNTTPTQSVQSDDDGTSSPMMPTQSAPMSAIDDLDL
jgi:predicted RNA-binding protein YlqC (UPF0109 family)